MMLIGTGGVYTYTFQHERKPDCPVCGDNSKPATLSKDMKVEELLEWLLERQDMCVFPFPVLVLYGLRVLKRTSSLHSQAKKPSISLGGKPIYLQAPPQLELATRPNLSKTVAELVPEGSELTVTSSSLPFSLTLQISYS